MRGAALLFVLVMAAGCSTHARIDARVGSGSGSAVPSPGSSVTSSQAGVHIHSHSLAALVIAGMFMAAAIEDARQDRPFPSFSSFADWFRGTPAPKMAADRVVSEQDCSRPIELSGNLKCR